MSSEDNPLSLADLLNYLFEVIQHPDGRPYTELEVARVSSVSFSTINHIRTGRSANPSITTIKGLCRFFDIPLSYFEATTYQECRAMLASQTLRRMEVDDPLNEIALRASGLSEDSQREILQIIGWVQAAERERLRATRHRDDHSPAQDAEAAS